jgi:hypothetical protein
MNLILLILLMLHPQAAQHQHSGQKVRVSTTNHSVTLAYGASVVGANCSAPASISYNIMRGGAAGQESSTPLGTSNTTGYVDTSVNAGSTYFYTVVGVELCGTTSIPAAPSNEVSVTIPVPVPSAPSPATNLTATPQ